MATTFAVAAPDTVTALSSRELAAFIGTWTPRFDDYEAMRTYLETDATFPDDYSRWAAATKAEAAAAFIDSYGRHNGTFQDLYEPPTFSRTELPAHQARFRDSVELMIFDKPAWQAKFIPWYDEIGEETPSSAPPPPDPKPGARAASIAVARAPTAHDEPREFNGGLECNADGSKPGPKPLSSFPSEPVPVPQASGTGSGAPAPDPSWVPDATSGADPAIDFLGAVPLPPMPRVMPPPLPEPEDFDVPQGNILYRVCWQHADDDQPTCQNLALPYGTPVALEVDGDLGPDVAVTLLAPDPEAAPALTAAALHLERTDLLDANDPEPIAVYAVIAIPDAPDTYAVLGIDGRSSTLPDHGELHALSGDGETVLDGAVSGVGADIGYLAGFLDTEPGSTDLKGATLARFMVTPANPTFSVSVKEADDAHGALDGTRTEFEIEPGAGTHVIADILVDTYNAASVERHLLTAEVEDAPASLAITARTFLDETHLYFNASAPVPKITYRDTVTPDRDVEDTFTLTADVTASGIPAHWNLSLVKGDNDGAVHYSADAVMPHVSVLTGDVSGGVFLSHTELEAFDIPDELHVSNRSGTIDGEADSPSFGRIAYDASGSLTEVTFQRAATATDALRFRALDLPTRIVASWDWAATQVLTDGAIGLVELQTTNDGVFSTMDDDHAFIYKDDGVERLSARLSGLSWLYIRPLQTSTEIQLFTDPGGQVLNVYLFDRTSRPGERVVVAGCIGPLPEEIKMTVGAYTGGTLSANTDVTVYIEMGKEEFLDGGWELSDGEAAPPLPEPPWLHGVGVQAYQDEAMRLTLQVTGLPTGATIVPEDLKFKVSGFAPKFPHFAVDYQRWQHTTDPAIEDGVLLVPIDSRYYRELWLTAEIVDPPTDLDLEIEQEGKNFSAALENEPAIGPIDIHVETLDPEEPEASRVIDAHVSGLPAGANSLFTKAIDDDRYRVRRSADVTDGTDGAIDKVTFKMGQFAGNDYDLTVEVDGLPRVVDTVVGSFDTILLFSLESSDPVKEVDVWAGEKFIPAGEIDINVKGLGSQTKVYRLNERLHIEAPNTIEELWIGYSGEREGTTHVDYHATWPKNFPLVVFELVLDLESTMRMDSAYVHAFDINQIVLHSRLPDLVLEVFDAGDLDLGWDKMWSKTNGGSGKVLFWSILTIFPLGGPFNINAKDWKERNIGLSAWSLEKWQEHTECVDWKPGKLDSGVNHIHLDGDGPYTPTHVYVDPLQGVTNLIEWTYLRVEFGDWKWAC